MVFELIDEMVIMVIIAESQMKSSFRFRLMTIFGI